MKKLTAKMILLTTLTSTYSIYATPVVALFCQTDCQGVPVATTATVAPNMPQPPMANPPSLPPTSAGNAKVPAQLGFVPGGNALPVIVSATGLSKLESAMTPDQLAGFQAAFQSLTLDQQTAILTTYQNMSAQDLAAMAQALTGLSPAAVVSMIEAKPLSASPPEPLVASSNPSYNPTSEDAGIPAAQQFGSAATAFGPPNGGLPTVTQHPVSPALVQSVQASQSPGQDMPKPTPKR